MDIYLAATFSRQLEMRSYRDELEKEGHFVVSSWIDVENEDFRPTDKESLTMAQGFALTDLNEVAQCDIFLMFTREDGKGQGHHVEFGVAYQRHKQIWIVGPYENIFQSLVPELFVVPSFEALMESWRRRKWVS